MSSIGINKDLIYKEFLEVLKYNEEYYKLPAGTAVEILFELSKRLDKLSDQRKIYLVRP
ncbi:MAG: hypothetical protein Q7U04_17060 [Bacteriovorax sp.]|nr:hypothetical protein [Bacteriovorax sp.]